MCQIRGAGPGCSAKSYQEHGAHGFTKNKKHHMGCLGSCNAQSWSKNIVHSLVKNMVLCANVQRIEPSVVHMGSRKTKSITWVVLRAAMHSPGQEHGAE